MQDTLSLTLPQKLKEPRDYQHTILDGFELDRKEFSKLLVVCPTGSGKGSVLAWMCGREHTQGKKSLILVDQKNLLEQTAINVKECTGLDAEIESGASSATLNAPIVIATVQSMVNRLDDWPAHHFSLIIADEADKSLAPTWMACLQHFDEYADVCGFTATPWRGDAKELSSYYEKEIVRIMLPEMIERGWLSKLCIQQLPLKINTDPLEKSGKDYSLESIDHAITPYLGSVIDAMQTYGSDRKTLVFVPLVRTSERFVSMCLERGIAAEHIDGESDDRDAIITRFKHGNTMILVNSMLLTRGIDIPCISRIVPLRLTGVIALYHQMIGRGTRLYPGKDNLMVFDFLYQAENMLICRPSSLIAKNKEQADAINEIMDGRAGGEQMDLLEADRSGTHLREEKLAEKLAQLAARKAKFISAEEFAIRHKNLELAEFQPTMHWQLNAPTEKQVKWLEKAGIDAATVNGTEHAKRILDVVFEELDRQPASPGQRWRMKQAGWISKDGKRGAYQATKRDAKDFFISLNRK